MKIEEESARHNWKGYSSLLEQEIQRHSSRTYVESVWPGSSEQWLGRGVGDEDRDWIWTGASKINN